jgi:hypothetical protein
VLIVSILASFCVWTKPLKYKDAVNRDSTIQSDVRRFCLQVRRISSSLSAVRTIKPSRPDANLSTVPYVRTTCSTIRTAKIDQHHPSGRSVHSVWTPYCIEKFLCQLASVRTFQQHVRTPLSTQLVSDFFPSSKKGKINQPSEQCGIPSGRASPKARITIQISPSGRLTAMVWTRVHQRRKLPIRLQPSGRLPIMVRTRAL